MKNKKGLEAVFALLLLKFISTSYFASTIFLTKCDLRPFCSAGEGPGGVEHRLRYSHLPNLLPVCSDSSIALKLGCTSASCRDALW